MSVNVEAYYQRYGPMVLRRCRYMLRDEHKALDAMQDVFVKLIRSQERLTEKAPSSLLLCMATNVCLNRLRSEKRRPESQDDKILLQLAESKFDTESRFWAKTVLSRMFSQEKESTWTIAVLHLVDGLTLEEVSKEVGLSVSGVRKRLRSLRGRVAKKGIEV